MSAAIPSVVAAAATRRPLAPALGIAAAIGWVSPALGAPWNLEPSFELTSSYQSNPQFYPDGARAGWGAIATVTAPLDWQDGRTRVALTPTANAGVSEGAAGLGRDNRSADLSWTRAGELASWRAAAGVSRVDLFGSGQADLGVLRPVGYTTRALASGGLRLSLSERGQLDVGLSRQRLEFHDPAQSYIDYSYSVATGQYSYALDERTSAFVELESGRFEPSADRPVSRDQSLQFGLTRQLTQTLSASLSAGRSATRPQPGARTETGGVYTAKLVWTGLRSTLRLDAARSLQPGSFGDLATATDVAASWDFAWTARARLTGRLHATRVDDEFLGVRLDRREYRAAEIDASYQLTPQWTLQASALVARAGNAVSVFHPTAVDAVSTGGSVAFARRFGRTPLF